MLKMHLKIVSKWPTSQNLKERMMIGVLPHFWQIVVFATDGDAFPTVHHALVVGHVTRWVDFIQKYRLELHGKFNTTQKLLLLVNFLWSPNCLTVIKHQMKDFNLWITLFTPHCLQCTGLHLYFPPSHSVKCSVLLWKATKTSSPKTNRQIFNPGIIPIPHRFQMSL